MRPAFAARRSTLSVLLAVLLAGVGALAWWYAALGAPAVTDAAVQQARAAGRQVALDVSSYDYQKLPAQFGTVAGETTGSALTSFQKDKTGISSYVTSNKLVTTATVNTDAAVPGARREAVPVLVALTVSETAAGKAASVGTVLVRVAMVHSGGRWLAEGIS